MRTADSTWRWITAHPVKARFRAFTAAAAAATVGLVLFNHLPGWLQITVVIWTTALFAAIPGIPVFAVITARDEPRVPAYTPPPRPLWRIVVGRALSTVGRLLRIAVMAGALAFTLFMLPVVVNSAGYLTGAGHTALFVPVTQGHVTCGRGGCSSTTTGYLEVDGRHAQAVWPNIVTIGVPFPVRTLIWNAPSTDLVGGDGFAITRFGLWLMVTLWDTIFIPMGVLAFRFRRRSRQPEPASIPSS